MKLKVLDSSYILDFINVGFDSKNIRSIIEHESQKDILAVDIEKLKDWEIQFIFRYNHCRQILIYTKAKSFAKEKYKEITVHIPIPTMDLVSWGVNKEQYIYKDEGHLDNLLKNFSCLDVKYSTHADRKDYILDCMRRSIKYCFESGFTINGVKIKTPK